MRRPLALALLVSVALGCGDEEPAADVTAAQTDDGPALDGGGDEGETSPTPPPDEGPPPPTCPPAPVEAGHVRARALDCDADLPQGPLVAAQVGDLVLENAVARFVIRAGDEGHAIMGLTGGNVVDAVLLDEAGDQRGDDGLREYVVSAAFHLLAPEAAVVESDGADGVARVRVTGALWGLPTVLQFLPYPEPQVVMQHEYVLRPDVATLEIVTRLDPTGPGSTSTQLADLMFWGGSHALFVPGFGTFDLPEGATTPTVGVAPAHAAADGAAYATGADAPRELLNLTAVRGFLYSTTEVPPEGAEVRRYLALGPDLAAATAAIADALNEPVATVEGMVEGAFDGVVVDALDADGAPLTRCRTAPDGAFECRVPVGTTSLRAGWIGSGTGERGGDGQSASESSPLGSGEPLTLAGPAPARLTVAATGPDGGPIPFRASAWRDGGSKHERRHVVSLGDPLDLLLPAGAWQLWVTHGPTWSWHHAVLELAPGQEQGVEATLNPVVDTTGWVAADLHVHAQQSPDSDVPPARRLIGAVAEGLGYVVSTEHDFIANYADVAEALGVTDRLIVRPGVEVSTMHLGHFNFWPATERPELSGQGAPRWFDHTADSLLALLHEPQTEGATPLVQCNHPEFASGYAAFFDVVSPLDTPTPPALLACDLLEVVNGFASEDTADVLAIWSELHARGVRLTATGTSDSHETAGFVGNPRTWVYIGDAPANAQTVEAALREGHAVASSGPFLELHLLGAGDDPAGPGDTLDSAGEVTAQIRVSAPEWMALGTVHVVVGAAEVHLEDLSAVPAAEGARKWALDLPLTVAPGDFVFVWHDPVAPVPPGTHQPGWTVTNPVFIAP